MPEEKTMREQIDEQLAVFREIDVAILESYRELPQEFQDQYRFESYYNMHRGLIRVNFKKLKEEHTAEVIEAEEKEFFEEGESHEL